MAVLCFYLKRKTRVRTIEKVGTKTMRNKIWGLKTSQKIYYLPMLEWPPVIRIKEQVWIITSYFNSWKKDVILGL